MAEEKIINKQKLSEEEVKDVNGGYGYGYYDDGWRTVVGLQSGYLAMRTRPAYDYNNEIRGCELHNNDRVQITGSPVPVTGTDGYAYLWVFSPKYGVSGYVNASYLA